MRKPLIVLVVLLLALSSCTIEQAKTYGLINATRIAHGLPTLLPEEESAQRKAELHAIAVAASEQFPWHSNLASGMSGEEWTWIGENVGRGPDVAAVHAGFMQSPEHRANILYRWWKYMGVGIAPQVDGTGVVVVYVFWV